MKKFFSIICVLLLSAVLFAGCGVAGSNTLVAIKFTQQVFYVDEDCPTKLTYNVYPSTASNFGQARISTSTQTFGELINGVITADEKFGSVTVNVQAGGLTDSCFVVRKEYPTQIYLGHNNANNGNMVLCTGGTTSLKLDGKFENEWVVAEDGKSIELQNVNKTEKINQEIFNVKLTSSDPSVVQVVDSSKMQIRGVGSGTATITACLVDDGGNEKHLITSSTSALTINVFNSASTILVHNGIKFEENNKFASTTIAANSHEDFYAFLQDANGEFITNDAALKLLNVSILTAKTLSVSTQCDTMLGVRCLKITLTNTSTTDSLTTNISDKLVFSADSILASTSTGLNKIVALG